LLALAFAAFGQPWARKLLIAFWRLVTTGEMPEGVILRPAI
jgi:hypothetical protein